MSFVFLMLFFNFIGWLGLPEDILQIAGGWFMLAWFGGLALFLGALSETYEIIEKLWHPASYMLFPLSGAAFLVDALPRSRRKTSCSCRWCMASNMCAKVLRVADRAHYDMGTWPCATRPNHLGLAQDPRSAERWCPNDQARPRQQDLSDPDRSGAGPAGRRSRHFTVERSESSAATAPASRR